MNYSQIKRKMTEVANADNCYELKAFFVSAYYLVRGDHGFKAMLDADLVNVYENNSCRLKDTWMLKNIIHKMNECTSIIQQVEEGKLLGGLFRCLC